jgi:3-oxoacyl-[acyl-carrier protein] reductase
MDLDLKGRRALVTGASRGIGRAIVERLVGEGAQVAACARDGATLDATVADIGADSVRGWSVDVADGDALTGWVDEASGWLDGIDIVVQCATASVPGTSSKAFQAHLDVDVLGLSRLAKAAQPHLERSGVGSIVTIGTTAAIEQFGPGVAAYNALKAAVVNYTAGLSQALGPKGIRANCVSPGPIFIEGGSWDQIKAQAPQMYDQTVAASPFGRLGTADEVARVVTFVASPAASWITGENVVVDGGFTKRVAF